MNFRNVGTSSFIIFIAAGIFLFISYYYLTPMLFPRFTTRIGLFSNQFLTAWIYEKDHEHNIDLYRGSLTRKSLDNWELSLANRYRKSPPYIRYELQSLAIGDELALKDLEIINGGCLVSYNDAYKDRNRQ